MRTRVLLFAPLLLVAARLHAQVPELAGIVTDSATGLPISGVRVVAVDASRSAVTDDRGQFRLARVRPGDVRFARIGYRPLQTAWSGSGSLAVVLAAVRLPLEPVVISASRTEQAALDAPAATSTVGREEVAAEPALTVADHLARTPGFDMAEKGVIQRTYSVRGDRGTNSLSLLTLTDYRNSSVPSLGFNVPYIIPATDDDIERIELTRGPGAALWGPGADRGVLHIITRSPFESQGLTLTLTGGERELAEGSVRYATVLTPRVAVKLSGDYLRARDWGYRDTMDVPGLQRDPIAERFGGEARLDWRPDAATEVVTSAGYAKAVRVIEAGGDAGPAQVRDWSYTTFQARARRDRLFVNGFYNLSNTGSTYVMHTGENIVDSSRMAAAQIQDGATLGRVNLLFGADWRWTNPRTGRTIDGANEDHDNVTETGAYVHGTLAVGPRAELTAALRVDHHSVLGDNVLSPRVGVVYHPAEHHALRFTFNRAFSSPDANTLFLDIPEGPMTPLPFDLRAGSIPHGGYQFDRSCGGLCMNTSSGPLSTDPTQFWGSVIVPYLQSKGIDVSSVPAPTAADIGPAYWAFDPATRRAVAASAPTDIPTLKRTLSTTFEAGWKVEWDRGGSLSLDLYTSSVTDPLLTSFGATPWVAIDGNQTYAYLLAKNVSADTAAAAATEAAQLPLGLVTPIGARPNEVLVLPRQGGTYRLYGADIAATVPLNATWRVSGYLSLVSDDSIANVGPAGSPMVMGVPKTKGSASVGWSDTTHGLDAELTVRSVQSFPISSGLVYIGRVAAYTLLDARFGMPLGPRLVLLVEGRNLTDNRHQEFVMTPYVGRMIVTRLRMTL